MWFIIFFTPLIEIKIAEIQIT